MKIAIFHNYMDNIGGAERVCLTLARDLKADLYSTNINYDSIKKLGFNDIKLKSIGRVPINAPYKQQAALARFRYFKPKIKYDFYIIAGDWAIGAAVLNKPNLCYVHSPIREIWDLYKFTREHSVSWYERPIFDLWVQYNRHLNKSYFSHADKIACNSLNTQARIKKYVARDACVIYPPVETKKFYYKENGNFWLSVNRLLAPKRVTVQLEAFKQLSDEKLVIVGCYEKARHFKKYAAYVNSIKPRNVKILNRIDLNHLLELYARCKGFITTAQDEDFGMTAVEAMASGKPVIAPNEGGYKESVINNVTGILINDINANKLASAVKKVSRNPIQYKDSAIARARKFDTDVFIKKIINLINE